MVVYSHSRLSCFEQCPQKYKLKYLDKVDTEIQETIEAYLGSCVHETLEKLYKDLEYQKLNSLDELIEYLHQIWRDHWTKDIIIVKKNYGKENYLRMAERYITDYYNRYKPFNQGKTISIEERILIDLDTDGSYKLQGYIDRLTEIKDGCYEIHDYKTNARLPLPQYIENDRQLALYAIGVKKRYPDAKNIRLVWHFLKFDKEIDSTRKTEELKQLKKDTIQLIDTIEQTTTYPTHPSPLCEWCEFKPICKHWSHLYTIREKTENEYLSDLGVKLVNRYAVLKEKKKQITLDLYAEMDKIQEALIHYATKEDIDVIYGTNQKIRIKTTEKYKFPSKQSQKRKQLIDILKKNGKWDEVDQLDTNTLNHIIQQKQWDETLLNILKTYAQKEKSKRLYLSNIKK
mgnify:CR=1 FL=1